MTPAARLAAALEILDRLEESRAPTDATLKAWGKAHRFAGSGDRRAIAERVYATLRARARLAWRMGADDGRALVLAAVVEADGLKGAERLFSGEGHGPAALTDQERAQLSARLEPEPDWVRAGLPEWMAEPLRARFGEDWVAEAQALILDRAPVDLRVNAMRGGLEAAVNLLRHDGFEPEPTPWSAWGLRLPATVAADIQSSRAYKTGWVEVQDEGSQLAAALADARPGMTVVDYCAGAGGKTLALGMQLHSANYPAHPRERGDPGLAEPRPLTSTSRPAEPLQDLGSRVRGNERNNEAKLYAFDVHAPRLTNLAERLARAGVAAEVRRIGPEGQGTEPLTSAADLVFVDAPCSGSGTWRRRPDGPWKLTAEAVDRLSALQSAILARAAALVCPGGRLVYVTCSVLPQENDLVAAAFATAHPQFRPVPIVQAAAGADLTPAARALLAALANGAHTVQLTPRRTGTDGFFIALFERSP